MKKVWKHYTQADIDAAAENQISEAESIAREMKLPERDKPTEAQMRILYFLASHHWGPMGRTQLACHYKTLVSLWRLGMVARAEGAGAAWVCLELRASKDKFLATSKGIDAVSRTRSRRELKTC